MSHSSGILYRNKVKFINILSSNFEYLACKVFTDALLDFSNNRGGKLFSSESSGTEAREKTTDLPSHWQAKMQDFNFHV